MTKQLLAKVGGWYGAQVNRESATKWTQNSIIRFILFIFCNTSANNYENNVSSMA